MKLNWSNSGSPFSLLSYGKLTDFPMFVSGYCRQRGGKAEDSLSPAVQVGSSLPFGVTNRSSRPPTMVLLWYFCSSVKLKKPLSPTAKPLLNDQAPVAPSPL